MVLRTTRNRKVRATKTKYALVRIVMDPTQAPIPRASTGIDGIDHILGGGLPEGHLYLVDGAPGSGKTTLGLQFLLEGIELGERGIYVTLSETEAELRTIAGAHGWSMDEVSICDLQTAEESLEAETHYTLFHPSEVELSETTEKVLRTVEHVQPSRIVFDSLSEMRLLARDSLRYRRQILALKHYFSRRGATVLVMDTHATANDFQIASIAHGVLALEQHMPAYGGQRRRLRFSKVRGVSFREGWHDYRIRRGGLEVYPRLAAGEHRRSFEREQISSGVSEVDALVGGGLERGSSALLLGASGTGKSTLAMQYCRAAAERGERSIAFLFDELRDSWLMRGRSLGVPVDDYVERGLIKIHQVNAAELSPGELAHRIRSAVETEDVQLVLIDSVDGYRSAMPEERFLSLHLHEVLSYLGQHGVVTFLTAVQHGLVGDKLTAPTDLSYIADTVFLLRYFEAFGELRQAVSALKKRLGFRERQIRELQIRAPEGIVVGEALSEFGGVLSGSPTFHGSRPHLIKNSP